MPLPQRKSLPHTIPQWVRDDNLFFITVCCEPRGVNQLCKPVIAKSLFESLAFRNSHAVWHTYLCVLMPDHLHALICFPRDTPMRQALSNWKGFLAKTCAIEWQRDFFDHRLRNDESFREKAAYIRENPVRKGLCAAAEEWPFTWTAETSGPH
jgi:putative transposase